MDSNYRDILQEETINRLVKEYRFAHKSYVEKFIMCFEAHRRIAQKTECVVRGGLCMPFHQTGQFVRQPPHADQPGPRKPTRVNVNAE